MSGSSCLCACRPGQERRLAAELARTLPGARARMLAPGWVWSESPPGGIGAGAGASAGAGAGADAGAVRGGAGGEANAAAGDQPVLAFAVQSLPDPEPLPAPSVAAAARDLAGRLMARLADHQGPWRLHAFCQESPGSAARQGRGGLIAAQALALLRRRQKRLLPALTTAPAAPWAPAERLAQLALVTPRLAYFGILDAAARHAWRHSVSRFPGGRVDVPEDPAPPSRAYLKLLEAEAHLGRAVAAGDTCVDLGAAPGGWTHVALARGARVTAVDRAPLREDLMRSPRLAFQRGDAFRYAPAGPPADWLLSDVVARPPRVQALLETWLGRRWCRRFVVTVKFQGEGDDAALEPLKALLRRSGYEFGLRQLGHNRNEVTAYGEMAAR